MWVVRLSAGGMGSLVKRWRWLTLGDQEEVLRAGTGVLSTLEIQHLEE